MVTKETDAFNERYFDIADPWIIDKGQFHLGGNKERMPILYALVQKATAAGFDDWERRYIGHYYHLGDCVGTLSYDTVLDLINLYLDKEIGDEQDIYDEIEKDMAEWVREFDYDNFSFDMPF
jgi:hypothetical protein